MSKKLISKKNQKNKHIIGLRSKKNKQIRGKKNKKGGMLNGYSTKNEFIEEPKSNTEQLQKKIDNLDNSKKKAPITINVRTSEDNLKTIKLKVNKNDKIYHSICKGLLTYDIDCEKMFNVVIYFGLEPLEKNETFDDLKIDDGARLDVDIISRPTRIFMKDQLKKIKVQFPEMDNKERFKLATKRWKRWKDEVNNFSLNN